MMPNFKTMSVHTVSYLVGVLSPLIFLRPQISAALMMDAHDGSRCNNSWRLLIVLAVLTVTLHVGFMTLKRQPESYQVAAAALVWYVSVNYWEKILVTLLNWGVFEIPPPPTKAEVVLMQMDDAEQAPGTLPE